MLQNRDKTFCEAGIGRCDVKECYDEEPKYCTIISIKFSLI
jgi:hypothetical protein